MIDEVLVKDAHEKVMTATSGLLTPHQTFLSQFL